MKSNYFLRHAWEQAIWGIIKIFVCINIPVAIGISLLPYVSNIFDLKLLGIPKSLGMLQAICLNILIASASFDIFFFCESPRGPFKVWFPKILQNTIIVIGAFLCSIILICIVWDKAVDGFKFVRPEINIWHAFLIAIPIRVVSVSQKLITSIMSSIRNVSDEEFEAESNEPKS